MGNDVLAGGLGLSIGVMTVAVVWWAERAVSRAERRIRELEAEVVRAARLLDCERAMRRAAEAGRARLLQ